MPCAEKSLAPIGWRSRLMPAPWMGSKRSRIRAERCALSSLLAISQADESVSDAPNPSIVLVGRRLIHPDGGGGRIGRQVVDQTQFMPAREQLGLIAVGLVDLDRLGG